jgi:hypothetical protein
MLKSLVEYGDAAAFVKRLRASAGLFERMRAAFVV